MEQKYCIVLYFLIYFACHKMCRTNKNDERKLKRKFMYQRPGSPEYEAVLPTTKPRCCICEFDWEITNRSAKRSEHMLLLSGF
jgi:hypothetical protein